jgi:membrane protein YqaA with SNARE-associated domain
MDIIEAYLFLFFDSFFASLILCFNNEMAVKLMTMIGSYNHLLVFILALSGSMLGLISNFLIGKYLTFLKNTDFFKKRSKEMLNAEAKWNQFLIWMLLASFISALANPLSLLAGFLKTSFKKFLILTLISKFIYYFLLIFADFNLLHLLIK